MYTLFSLTWWNVISYTLRLFGFQPELYIVINIHYMFLMFWTVRLTYEWYSPTVPVYNIPLIVYIWLKKKYDVGEYGQSHTRSWFFYYFQLLCNTCFDFTPNLLFFFLPFTFLPFFSILYMLLVVIYLPYILISLYI